MIGTIVFCRLTRKGPCGMTVNNDIDDDSATKHGDSHTLLVFFGEGDGLSVAGLRFGLGIELGPVSLDVGNGGHSADALDQLACSPTVPVFHS